MSNRLPILANDIRWALDQSKRAAKASAEHALAVGHLLIEAKSSVPHGGWLPWLAANVGLSERSARGYMQLARSGLKSATVADLGIRHALARVAKSPIRFSEIEVGSALRVQARPPRSDLFAYVFREGADFVGLVIDLSDQDGRTPDLVVTRRPVPLSWVRDSLISSDFPLDDPAEDISTIDDEMPRAIWLWSKGEAGWPFDSLPMPAR